MPRQDLNAAHTAAIVSFKKYNSAPDTEMKAKKPEIRATPPDHIPTQTQDEDTEMEDAVSVEFRKAPQARRESVALPRLPFSNAEKLTRTEVTTTLRPDLEQQEVIDSEPQSTTGSLETIRRQEEEIQKLRCLLWSMDHEHQKLLQNDIPAYREVIAQQESALEKSSSEKMKYLEQQVTKWRDLTETSDQRASAMQRKLNDIENDVKQVHETLHERDQEIICLKSCVDGASGNRERLETARVLSRERDNLIRQRDDLVEQKESLLEECCGWRKDFEQVDRERKTLVGENQALQKELGHHKASAHRAILKNKVLQERIAEQEQSVTKAQQAAMSVLSQSLSAGLPDDRIRCRFSELFESLAEWARENAAAPDQAMLTHSENIQRWRGEGLFRKVGSANSSPNFNFDLRDDTAVDTLLNTALTRRLCRDFLTDPFWFAEESSPIVDTRLPDYARLETDVALTRLLNTMMKYHEGDEANVHSWRASTVQTLAGSDEARKRIAAFYQYYLEDKLLPRCEGLIRRPIPQADIEDLLKTVELFGNFSIELWSQKNEVHFYSLESFNKAFDHRSQCMEIARAVGIEEDDVTLDGRPIPVLVQPLIVGYGTHDGKDYDKYRIWSRAVVWVSKDGMPAEVPANSAPKN